MYMLEELRKVGLEPNRQKFQLYATTEAAAEYARDRGFGWLLATHLPSELREEIIRMKELFEQSSADAGFHASGSVREQRAHGLSRGAPLTDKGQAQRRKRGRLFLVLCPVLF